MTFELVDADGKPYTNSQGNPVKKSTYVTVEDEVNKPEQPDKPSENNDSPKDSDKEKTPGELIIKENNEKKNSNLKENQIRNDYVENKTYLKENKAPESKLPKAGDKREKLWSLLGLVTIMSGICFFYVYKKSKKVNKK